MYEPTSFDAPPKRGLPPGVKIGIGCGATVLLLILVCGGLTWYMFDYFLREARAFVADFESRGYARVEARVVDVNQPLTQPTVYLAQVVRINAPVDGDLAFAAQAVEINANVNGDIDFYGQVLKISSNAVVSGDVRVKGAQVVEVLGKVEGQVTGNFQKSRISAPPSQPTPPAPSPLEDTAEPAPGDVDGDGTESSTDSSPPAPDDPGD